MSAAAPGAGSPAGAAPAPDLRFSVLIPARMASQRLPGKALAEIGGLPMVVRVARLAARSGASRVLVATDDARILQVCAAHEVHAVLTRADHASGSDRLAEACAQLGIDGEELVVNLQGDEPLIPAGLIGAVAALLRERPEASMGTAAHAIDSLADYSNPQVVKLLLNARGMAQIFSRAPIPWSREHPGSAWWQGAAAGVAPLRHIGIYSYRAGFLRAFAQLAPAPTEALEALEQLRALWHGHQIAVHLTDSAPGAGVDTPADLERVRAVVRAAQG